MWGNNFGVYSCPLCESDKCKSNIKIETLHCVVSKNVPEEVNITGKVEFVNLEDDLALWAEKIIMACEAERTSKLEELTEAGYSIKDTAELVVKIIENALL